MGSSFSLTDAFPTLALRPEDERQFQQRATRVLKVGCRLLNARDGAFLILDDAERRSERAWQCVSTASSGTSAETSSASERSSASEAPSDATPPTLVDGVATVLCRIGDGDASPTLYTRDTHPEHVPERYDWAVLIPFSPNGAPVPTDVPPIAGRLCFLGRGVPGQGTTAPDTPTHIQLEDGDLLSGLACDAWSQSLVIESARRYRTFLRESGRGIYRVRFSPPVDLTESVEAIVQAMYERGRIAECNPIMARMYGYESPDALTDVLVGDLHDEDAMDENLATNRALVEANFEISDAITHEVDRHGNERHFSNTVFGITHDDRLHHLWGIQNDVTDRVNQRQRLATYSRTLGQLSKLQSYASPDPSVVLRQTLREAVGALDASWASVYLAGSTGPMVLEVFVCADDAPRGDGATATVEVEGTRVPGENPPDETARPHQANVLDRLRDVLADARAVASDNVTDDPQVSPLAALFDGRDVTSALLAPIRSGSNLRGCLVIENREARSWTQEDVTFSASISDFVSQTLLRREQEEARAALKRSEQRWRSLVESHPGGVVISIDERFVYANPAAARILGADSAEAVVGTKIRTLQPPGKDWSMSRDRLRTRAQTLQSGRSTEPWEHDILGLDGQRRTVVTHSVPITYKGRRAAQTVIRDVTERKEREEELRRAKNQAQEMNRLKSAFLANMSHEIRTPLTSVIGFSEILSEKDLGEESRIAEMIRNSGQRLLQTLNSVLDLSRLQAGAHSLHVERFDLCGLVRDVTDAFAPEARGAELALEIDVPETACDVELDPRAVDRILTNLVRNAIKFTPPGGHVQVSLDAADDTPDARWLRLQVSDTGIGIDEDFLPEVFEPFYQESSGPSRSHEGTGLGLSITKRLVELMNGTVDVESVKHEGTTFSVTLPASLSDANPTEIERQKHIPAGSAASDQLGL